MDFMKWVKNNKWIVLIILYVIAIIFQFHSNKWGFLGTSAGIGLIIALISTLFTYSNLIKKFIRKTKFFIGPSMFKWEATSSVNI